MGPLETLAPLLQLRKSAVWSDKLLTDARPICLPDCLLDLLFYVSLLASHLAHMFGVYGVATGKGAG